MAQFCPNARIVHIDIDASELDKIKAAHVGIVADVGQALDALLPLVADAPRTEWLARVAELRCTHTAETPHSHDPLTPLGLIRETARLVGDDAIVATDVGQHQMWTAQVYPFRRPRQWLTSGGLGTMGFGLPAAIGAAIARPDATVVCFSGDGSLMMNLQELATAAELGANVKVVLMNNNALGLVRQQQQLFYGKRTYASDFPTKPDGTPGVDFVRIAEACGLSACDLGSADDPAVTLDRALAQPGPCLIHAPIDVAEHVYPMVPPGAANSQMIGAEPHVDACV